VSNHDELMCNFFAQADALATGKTAVELRAENVPDHLIPHKTFTGNRPSLSILLPELNAYTTGQILAMYEHRVAVQVFQKAHAPLLPIIELSLETMVENCTSMTKCKQHCHAKHTKLKGHDMFVPDTALSRMWENRLFEASA